MAEPAYSFAIPSIEDDTTLECRIHHPKDLHATLDSRASGIKGAVLAHPYAPLGGCYDDPVVLSVTETLLKQGYVVGTFNFRGAGGSQGGTSWTGRGETEDYVSFAGFMIYYLQHLRQSTEDLDTLSPIVSADPRNALSPEATHKRHISILLDGYSYGSLVLARLPAIPTLIARFQAAPMGTAAAEIILRARTLARQIVQAIDEMQQSPKASRGRSLMPEHAATSPTKRSKAAHVTVGGEETDASERRRSRDPRRSLDIVRKSVELPRRLKAHIRHGSDPSKHQQLPAEENSGQLANNTAGENNGPLVMVHHLLVSPVILPFTTLICPPGSPTVQLSWRKGPQDANAGALFLQHPTLVVFGTRDAFTSSRRLRAWAEKQASQSAGFEWEQIEGAGHFWHEEGVMQAMQSRITSWVQMLR